MSHPTPSIDEIFFAAMERESPEARAAYLDEVCGSDLDLRRRVERLLDAQPKMGSFLDSPAAGPTMNLASAPGDGRPRHGHRPVQAAGADRRRRHGRRLHGRADPARAPQGGAEDHQAGHGYEAGHRPVRGRAPGAGDDGPPQHRQGARCRRHRVRPPLLRHGAGPRHPDHRVLRPAPPADPRAAGLVHAGLPGRAARPPEGDHPPRHQAHERPGDLARRRARPRSSTSASPRRPGRA